MPDDSVYHLNLVIDDLTNSIRQLNSGESLGYIREPKNVDLIVGPSVFAEATRQTIAQAIARYKKTGQKPVSVQITTQGASNPSLR